MATRFLQNFRGCKALILAPPGEAVAALEPTLAKLGVTPAYAPVVDGWPAAVAAAGAGYDLLFLDGDLGLDLDEPATPADLPIIGLVGSEAPSRLKSLIHHGATAFLRKPVHGSAVYTALFLGINQYLVRRDLTERVDDLERRRRSRRAVLKAVLRKMECTGLGDDEAYTLLRRESMRARRSLEEYCEDFLASGAAEPERTAEPAQARIAVRE